MAQKLVFVTGCTGRIGREFVARMGANSRFKVRAGIRDVAGKGDYLKGIGAAEVVPFDYTNPETWNEALDGVTTVYSSSLDPLLEHHLKFSKFLGSQKQIEHVVRISCMGGDTNTACYNKDKHASIAGAAIPIMLQHYWWAEKALIDAGLPITALRNNFFMNHILKTDADNIGAIGSKEPGWFSNPISGTNSYVSTADVAEAAAKVVDEGPNMHANKFYDITGPEPQYMHEIAEDLSTVLGKPVEFRPQSMEQCRQDFGPARAEFFEYLCNGFYTRCSADFYNIVGRRPTAYAEYLVQTTPSGTTGLKELYEGNIWKKGQDPMAEAMKLKI